MSRQQQQNNTAVVLFRFWMDLSVTVRVYILNYIGENNKQKSLRKFVLVSKVWNGDCKQPGIEWDVFPAVPLFMLSPLYDRTDGGSPINFLRAMYQYKLDKDTNRQIQRYRRMIVKGIDCFGKISHKKSRRLTQHIRMGRIESLQISLPSPTMTPLSNTFPYALSYMLPNLHELDATNANMGALALKSFFKECPNLEQITWSNIVLKSLVHLNGEEMQSGNELKRITMDNSTFYGNPGTLNQISDLNNNPDEFIFHKCCQVLERLSIRNAHYIYDEDIRPLGDSTRKCITQNALIKFVRNAPPSLKWFRSDLTQANMDMLRKERPDIELLN